VRIDGRARHLHAPGLIRREPVQRVQHLALKALHQLKRHIQEVAAAAGRVEHTNGAEPAVEGAHERRGGWNVTGPHRPFGRAPHAVPLLAQRLHHGRQHQTLYEGARGKLRAQPAALLCVQRVLQQGAEDGRLYLGPVLAGSLQQPGDFGSVHRQRLGAAMRAGPEQAAVEAEHGLLQRNAESASVHRCP